MSDTAPKPMRGFHATTVVRPVAALVILITLIVLGLISYSRIPLQLLPSGFEGTRFTVFIQHPGSSAQENDDKVVRVLEEQIRTLPDIDQVRSRSSDSSCRMSVSFSSDGNLDLAKAELRDRIERARPSLPDTVDRITVWANDDGEPPIMWFAILADSDVPNIDHLIETRIQRQLEGVDGISRVNIFGLLDDSIRILLDEDKVAAAKLNVGDLIQRLAADNFSKPLGEVSDGGRRFLLRSDMRFEDFEEVEDYPVGNGLRLRDIARVERVKTVRDRLTRINGRIAYYGFAQKESGANVVEVGDRVQEAIDGFQTDPVLAGKFGLEVFFNQADVIRNSLEQLENTALWGGGLAVIVLFVFLRRFRMTLCVALSIPVSVLLALTWEYFTGGSFNVLTMTGLTLALGMLVDNSVVVIENIARLRGEGKDRRTSAIEGARDVGLAITLATMTTVVVFLPLVVMISNQQLRLFLSAMALPLCMALLFSLAVALIFLPVTSANVLGDRPRWLAWIAERLAPFTEALVRPIAWLIGGLRWCLALFFRGMAAIEGLIVTILTPLRFPVAAGLVAAIVWQVQRMRSAANANKQLDGLGLSGVASDPNAMLPMAIGAGITGLLVLLCLPTMRRALRARTHGEAAASLVPQGGSILGWVQAGNRRLLGWTIQHRLLATFLAFASLASVGIPNSQIQQTSFESQENATELEIDVDLENNFTLGEASAEMRRYEEFLEPLREDIGFQNLIVRFRSDGGYLSLRWKEAQDIETMEELRKRLRRQLPRFPGHRLVFASELSEGTTSKQLVEFQLRGTDAKELDALGAQAATILSSISGLSDVRSMLEEAPEQLRLSIDRESAFALGVTSQSALRSVGWALRGAQLSRYQEAGREVPFLIEYDSEKLAGLDTLNDLNVFTDEGPVALSAFASIDFQPGRQTIRRSNGMTTFDIQARVESPTRQLELVTAGYDALEAELDLPRGFSLGRDASVVTRQFEEFNDMKRAMLLSIVLVFLLMGILFESVVLPFSVLGTIPFAYLGAMWTLFLTDTTMDPFGYVGIIILVGVVVNNGIVLVDKIHRLRTEDGMPRDLAVQEGASTRVRPILMTAMTTVFGLLPMALSQSGGNGVDYRALATIVAGGLTLSTFFTLWVVPLAYTVADDFGAAMREVFRTAFQGQSKRPQAASSPGSSGGTPTVAAQHED